MASSSPPLPIPCYCIFVHSSLLSISCTVPIWFSRLPSSKNRVRPPFLDHLLSSHHAEGLAITELFGLGVGSSVLVNGPLVSSRRANLALQQHSSFRADTSRFTGGVLSIAKGSHLEMKSTTTMIDTTIVLTDVTSTDLSHNAPRFPILQTGSFTNTNTSSLVLSTPLLSPDDAACLHLEIDDSSSTYVTFALLLHWLTRSLQSLVAVSSCNRAPEESRAYVAAVVVYSLSLYIYIPLPLPLPVCVCVCYNFVSLSLSLFSWLSPSLLWMLLSHPSVPFC